jgi:Na+/H+ antiporter NhaC
MTSIPIIFYALPLIFVLFLIKSRESLTHRIDRIIEDSLNSGITQMIIIFILAGAFANTLAGMGSIDVLKSLIYYAIPKNFILPGIFIVSGLIATAIGTSVGTIATMAPICLAIASGNEANTVLAASAAVAGAYLGDNLSMISDTTIAAVKTQEAENDKKFFLNLKLIIPAIVLTCLVYALKEFQIEDVEIGYAPSLKDFLIIMPYILVIALGCMRYHVLFVLMLSILISFIIGVLIGIPLLNLTKAMVEGMSSMYEISSFVVLMSIINSAIKYHGWMDHVENSLKKTSQKFGSGASYFVLFLFVVIANFITANNTISIIMCGDVAKSLREKLKLDANKMAAFIDMSSCYVHSLVFYAPQLILASSICKVDIWPLIKNSYYSFFCLVTIFVYFMANLKLKIELKHFKK